MHLSILACVEQLGMEDGRIRDSQITASSVWDNNVAFYGPTNARLNHPAAVDDGNLITAGAWTQYIDDINRWIQVDLGVSMIVSGIVLQGREDADQWVTKYKVTYRLFGSVMSYIVKPEDPQYTDDEVRPDVTALKFLMDLKKVLV